MKKRIRKSVFETASSAVHSLVINIGGLCKSELPTDKDGYIITDFGEFGDYDMGETIWSQKDKLSYLATECYYLNRWDTEIENSYPWECICDAICEYTGAKGIKLLHKNEPSLNHQVQPEYSPKFCDYYNETSVINFIFNKYVGVEMSHD